MTSADSNTLFSSGQIRRPASTGAQFVAVRGTAAASNGRLLTRRQQPGDGQSLRSRLRWASPLLASYGVCAPTRDGGRDAAAALRRSALLPPSGQRGSSIRHTPCRRVFQALRLGLFISRALAVPASWAKTLGIPNSTRCSRWLKCGYESCSLP